MRVHRGSSVRGSRLPVLGLLLVVTVVVGATGVDAAAAAQDPPAQGQCVDVYRRLWEMPERLGSGDRPDRYGYTLMVGQSLPPAFKVTYCWQGTEWMKTADPLSTNTDPNLCVGVRYSFEQHGGESPPDQLGPDAITQYEIFDPAVPPYTNRSQTYCRQGGTWLRQAPTSPPGVRERWSDTCVTVYVTNPNVPAHTTSPVRVGIEWNDDDEDEEFQGPSEDLIDPANDLVLYCHERGTGDWFLQPDATVQEKLQQGQTGPPPPSEEGRCIGFMGVGGGWSAPEELAPGRRPEDLGQGRVVDLSDYADDAGTYRVKHTMCFTGGRWRRADKAPNLGCASDQGGVDDGFLPAECWGRFPTGNYDINYDGGDWNDFSRKIYGFVTDFVFSITKGATQVALFSLGWAYNYKIGRFRGFGLNVGENFKSNLTHTVFANGFSFLNLCWFVLLGYVAINVLRGRASMALGELLVSVVLVSVATFLLTHRGDYMLSTWRFMDAATTDLLVVGNGGKPGDSDVTKKQVVNETQAALHEAFVEQPYDYLNWGHVVTGGPCEAARDQAVLSGPHSDHGAPREIMEAAGAECQDEAQYNKKPSGTRLLAAIITAVAAVTACGFLIAVGLTVVVAKFVTLLLFMLLPFAVLTVVLPGGGRRLFWVWAASVGQAVGAVVCMGFLLALMLQCLKELFRITQDVSMVERFMLVLLLVLLLMGARRRMLASAQVAAGRWADNLSNIRLGGGGAAWQGATGSRGVNFTGADRLMGNAATRAAVMGVGAARGAAVIAGRTAAAPLVGAKNSVVARYGRRQTQRFGLENLQKMKRYDEAAGHVSGSPIGFNRRRGPKLAYGVGRPMTARQATKNERHARERALGGGRKARRYQAEAQYWKAVGDAFKKHDPDGKANGSAQFWTNRKQFWKDVEVAATAHTQSTGRVARFHLAPRRPRSEAGRTAWQGQLGGGGPAAGGRGPQPAGPSQNGPQRPSVPPKPFAPPKPVHPPVPPGPSVPPMPERPPDSSVPPKPSDPPRSSAPRKPERPPEAGPAAGRGRRWVPKVPERPPSRSGRWSGRLPRPSRYRGKAAGGSPPTPPEDDAGGAD